MTNLSDQIKKLETQKEQWESLTREILATILLEKNSPFFADLPKTWHDQVKKWKMLIHEYNDAGSTTPLIHCPKCHSKQKPWDKLDAIFDGDSFSCDQCGVVLVINVREKK